MYLFPFTREKHRISHLHFKFLSYALYLQEITMPFFIIYIIFIPIGANPLQRAFKQMQMTSSRFTFTFLRRRAERKPDVAKEKNLVFQLARFQKQLKPLLLHRHF